MNKLSVLFLASVLALFVGACQTAGTANTTDVASADPATPAATAADNVTPTQPTAPAPTQPAHIAKAEGMAKTTVEWEDMEYDFKSVPAGTTVTYQFKFKNTGENPLTLTQVKPSCGCTTPSYSKEPVAPGADGFIDIAFNTTGKTGIQSKTVTVTGNFDGNLNQVLRVKGEVEAAPAN